MIILKVLWQLPQIILGALFLAFCFIIGKFHGDRKEIEWEGKKYYFWQINWRGVGVSLSEYFMIMSYHYNYNVHVHEIGHAIKSKKQGLFYLLLSGIPSAFRNILNRIFKFGPEWYYGKYPEKQANDEVGLTIEDLL